MAPIPQDSVLQDTPSVHGERVVISGMSGLYPSSHNVQELSDILYNKKNPISASRWDSNHPEARRHTGVIPELDRFDGQFFKVHNRLGIMMDPMARKLLEQAFQAIYDAGVSPAHIYGKKVGVYVGSCLSEAEKLIFYQTDWKSGLGIAGCNKSMFANRISYWLNLKGPSFSIDAACCSSSAVLEEAFLDISRGACEAAIVGGCNLCLHAQSSVQFSRVMKASMDGKTKSFDQHADGCTRSEAICVFFLQKAKDALRVYAEVINIENKFIGLLKENVGPNYGLCRDFKTMVNFIENFYEKTGIHPSVVEYVDANGSGIPEADKGELEVLDAVFCKNRGDPLMVGSVMSNIGYCEAASGMTAITKVLLGYHNGVIAANLNCETPRQDVKGLCEGRMRIVTEHEKFRRTYAAVNSISITGVNCHVLLHGNYKRKDLNRYKSSIPHLVTISGRQDSSLEKVFHELKSRPIDPEQLALLHNVHSTTISGHLGRGFIILDTNDENQTVSLCEKADYFDDLKRPLCFVYSGMGSQWAGMGAQLMRIPIFAAAIERCHKALEPKGIDIVHIITTPDKNIFDNILHSFVGIAAIQIGLTDILQAVGLVPDIIIGHSVGELGCAYSDGCFTAEEMILAAYYRGLVSVQTPFIRGSMAAIGIGYQEIKDVCPPEIEVACHNGPDSCTLSGPAEVMKLFVEQLSAKSIFAKEVPCSNIAYHSRYIADAGPALLKYLSEVIKAPKARSKRWLSTSVPQDKWDEPAAQYSSAEYHANNLLNPVLFEETSRLLPTDAVLVEIAPHGLLQAILKRSLSENCHHIPMTKRGHADNARYVLEAIGKLYIEGYLPKVDVLYPKVEFPVSTGTPFLSNLVGWMHAEKWILPLFEIKSGRVTAAASKFIISVHDDDHSYLNGNVIRGKTYYPFAAALVAVWDTFAMSTGYNKKQLSVKFSNVHLYTQPILHDRRQLRISVALHRGTGRFEIMDEDSKVATGYIVAKIPIVKQYPIEQTEDTRDIILKCDDVYKLFRDKGYLYNGMFRSIQNVNQSLTKANIQWNENWVILIDGLLQLSILRNHEFSEPNIIRSMGINVEEHTRSPFIGIDDKVMLEALVFPAHDVISCGGVTLETVLFRNIPVKENAVLIKSLKFIPQYSTDNMNISTILDVYLQIIAENTNTNSINILELLYNDKSTVLCEVKEIVDNLAGDKFQYKQADMKSILKEYDYILSDIDVLLVKNLSTDNKLFEILLQVLNRNTFIINLDETHIPQILETKLYHVLSSHNSEKFRLSLIRWRPEDCLTGITTISIKTHSDLAKLTTTKETLSNNDKLVILTPYPLIPELKELVDSWRKKSNHNKISLITISNDVANQTLNKIPELHLTFNTLYNETWGGEYYIPWNDDLNVKQAVTLKSEQYGDLDTIRWIELHESDEKGIPVTVHYAGLNILDSKRAAGLISLDDNSDSYGMDFSGITDSGKAPSKDIISIETIPALEEHGVQILHIICRNMKNRSMASGQRVMGLIAGGAASTRVRALPELLWPVPEHWTLEDAATVPLAYAQAYYCLAIKTQIRPLMRILVHGGAGALGQAFISIALSYNCHVFTTVGDAEKKRFLLRLFPKLKEDQIGYSRNHSFSDMVLTITKGQGCDLVISCVNEELKNMSLRCSGYCGITFDFSQLQNRHNFDFGMGHLTAERSYCLINLFSIFSEENRTEMKRIQALISDGIALGTVRPLSRMMFAPQEASRALRLLANSQHRGRVLLQLQDFNLPAQPRISCTPNQWHIVFCQEDFGLQWAERLIHRGARRLRLHFSQVSNYTLYRVQSLQQNGVEIKITSENLNDTQNILTLFNDCTKIGSIEGIYLIATIVNHKMEQNFIAQLDLLSRKFSQTLKYFAVISTDDMTGQHICLGRAQDQLPATKVILSSSKNKEGVVSISWRSALDIMEKAICCSQTIVMAHPKKVMERSLLTHIAKISEIELPQELDDTTNLQSLGVQDIKVPEIANFLRDTYSICYDDEQIMSLSVKGINDLEDLITKTDFEDDKVKGLRTFYAYVDSDEIKATTNMVFLPTLTHSASMRDVEFDAAQKYLCIIPGLEGHYKRFTTLSERLKLNALVLQPGLDNLQETIPEMAERFVKMLMKKVGLKSTFCLLGYECGIMVTLEMANILEQHGLTGTIFCVGAAPKELKAIVENEVSGYDTEEFQEAVAQHMFTLLTNNSAAGTMIDFKKYSTWKEKKEACVRTLAGHKAYSTQYAKSHIETAYSRIEHVLNYKPKPYPLQSKIIMLKVSGIQTCETDEMQEYSQQPVVTYHLQAPLGNASEDLRCANIINRHLEGDIIQAFDQKNLCETYVRDGNGLLLTEL